jgi:transposase-like protein
MEATGEGWLQERMQGVLEQGKRAFDACALELGRMLAQTMMYMEREEMAGPDYHPRDRDLKKWASQRGSVYIGGSKVGVNHPRLRSSQGEVALRSYETLKDPQQFSQELLAKALRGLSGRRYRETVLETAGAFGISPSSVSNRFVEATSREVRELLERDLRGIDLFALVLDTVYRGGVAFVVAVGMDVSGKKWVLGFWEGATESHTICQALLSDLESRGLRLGPSILFLTDGGSGICKALKDRYGEDLLHQRCTIHKGRNLQDHLPKRYRKEAHRRYYRALELKSYAEAKAEFQSLERWLREINGSAADSLLEAQEEILTLHRLEAPELLRKSLSSTNGIEAVFSQVRQLERNIKRYSSSAMLRRWLASCLLHAEKGFRTIRGAASIPILIGNIQREQEKKRMRQAA